MIRITPTTSISTLALTLALFLFSYIPVFTQHTVSGQLLDENQQPAGFVNVLLLNAKDSSMVKATVSEPDGSYTMKELESGQYLLQTVILGYEDHWSEPFHLEADYFMPDIPLQTAATELATVEVTADKPLLEQRAGKMVVNVENYITGTNGRAIDLLRKAPGLIVVNGQISMAGQEGVAIYINGKPTQYLDMASLLRDLPGDNIKRIEIISQPGARYDAEGNGSIVNIVLKKNVKLGTNGSASLGVGRGQLWKYRAGASLNYRDDKLNWSNQLSFNHQTHYEEMVLDRKVGDQRFVQLSQQPYLPYTGSLRSSLDYQLSERHSAGASINLLGSLNNSTDENFTSIRTPEVPTEELYTANELDRESGYVSTDAYYLFEIDTAGQQLSVDATFYRYQRRNDNLLSTLVNGAPAQSLYPSRRQQQPGNTQILALKADYEYPITNQQLLSVGLKYSQAAINNDLQAQLLVENTWQNDPALSNHFIFNEHIYAAYASWQFQFGELEGQAGLRYEDNRAEGYSVTLDSTTRRGAGRLFPSMSFSLPVAGKIGAALAYSYRIQRPNYTNLNPFILYMDPYTYQKGNPFLKPELTHSTKLSLTYDGQPFFNLEYNRTNDVMQLITEQDDDTGIAFGLTDNLDLHERIGGSLFFPLSFLEGLSGYGGFMLYYNRFESELLDAQYEQARWNFTSFLQANYKINDWLSAEASGWYTGPGIRGIMTYDNLYGISFGLETKLMDGQATLSLSADDLFFRYWTGSIQHSNLDIDIISRWETQRLNLAFTYQFGNRHVKKSAGRRSSANEETRRNKD